MEMTLPKGWSMVKLGEVENTKIIMGQSPPSSTYNTDEKGLPFFQGKAEFGEHYPVAVKWCSTPVKIAEQDDILISVRAPVGDVNICKTKSCVGRGLAAIRTNKTLNSKFLYWYLKKDINIWQRLTTGSTFSAISSKAVHNLFIPLPPLPTQKRIVEILEEADGLRKLRKQADEKIKDLIPSLFVKMFGDPATNPKGWEVKKLGEVCDVRDGTHDTPKYHQSGIPLITSKNLVGDTLDFENVRYISEQDHKQIIQRSLVENGDILFAMIGTIGNPVIVKTTKIFSIKNVALFKFEKATSLINHYLKHLLSNQNVIVVLTASAKGGNQKFVSLKILRTFRIPLPPLPLQQEFAARVEEIEAEKARQAKSKAKLDDLFNSLMQKAFKGELVA